jgi:hypothetical protein
LAGNAGHLPRTVRSERKVVPGDWPRVTPRHSAFDERLQPEQRLIALLGDKIEVFLDFFHWLRIEFK